MDCTLRYILAQFSYTGIIRFQAPVAGEAVLMCNIAQRNGATFITPTVPGCQYFAFTSWLLGLIIL